MAKGKMQIQYLKMVPADNGVVISWDEITPNSSGETYAMGCRNERSKVFDFDSDETEGDMMKEAMTFFMDKNKEMKGLEDDE